MIEEYEDENEKKILRMFFQEAFLKLWNNVIWVCEN